MPIILHSNQSALVVLDDIATLERDDGRPVARVIVTFANEEDLGEIIRLARAGKIGSAFKLACRGLANEPGDTAMVRIASNAESDEAS